MTTKYMHVNNPEVFAKALAACLGADLGIPAQIHAPAGDDNWTVVAGDKTLVLSPMPKSFPSYKAPSHSSNTSYR